MDKSNTGGVRATTAMHYFARFPTWRKIVVMRSFFCGIFVHRLLGFRPPFLYENVIFGKYESGQVTFWY